MFQGCLAPLTIRQKRAAVRDRTESNTQNSSIIVSSARMAGDTVQGDVVFPQAGGKIGHVGSLAMKSRILHFARLKVNNDLKAPGAANDPNVAALKMQYIAENLWKLKRPKVIISVTGGAKEFGMSRLSKDTLLQGLMKPAVETDVWFVTGGTDAGIMKYVGEAVRQYAADTPLIGIATWEVVHGNEKLKEKNLDGSTPQVLTPDDKGGSVALNGEHSHFFLITDESRQGEPVHLPFGRGCVCLRAF